MKFVFALLEDFHAAGMDTTEFRKSIDGTMALCHDKWAIVCHPTIETDIRFQILMHGTTEFDQIMLNKFTEVSEEPVLEDPIPEEPPVEG